MLRTLQSGGHTYDLQTLFLVAADNPLAVNKCTTFQMGKLSKKFQEPSVTVSSNSQITIIIVSAALVQVLAGSVWGWVNIRTPIQIPYDETCRTHHSKRK
jgi:hypothetical protein